MTDDLNEFLSWADRYLNFEKTPKKNIFWLDTIKFICDKLGNPQNSCPSFHVAGSKGKGSVSAFLANILTEKGMAVGLYSSPHILDFRERITLSGKFFSDQIYSSSAREVMEKIEKLKAKDFPSSRPLTWFELVTAYAMLCFKNAKTDACVYEVGLGGTLDSTNIINPELCIITPIELEHTEFLGDTLEKIAFEKAGIIKEKTPVIVARQQSKSVKNVFKKAAKEKNAPVFFLDENLKISKEKYFLSKDGDFKMKGKIFSKYFKRPLKIETFMTGKMQLENAALASLAAKIAYPSLDEKIIERGINETRLPARFELIKNPAGNPQIPFIVLDGAHTVKSMKYTMQSFSKAQKLFKSKKSVLLFACAQDKDVYGMSKFFLNKFTDIFITKPGLSKKTDFEKIKAAFDKRNFSYVLIEDFKEAIKLALKKSKEKKESILVTGSFYLVSEVKKILTEDDKKRTVF